MSRKVSRWLNSKEGKRALLGLLALVVVVALVGQFAGWWAALGDAITGTAVEPVAIPSYPAPEGGYTCMPTCDETDGKFLSMPGEDMASFGGESAILWVSAPRDYDSLELGFFDGDSGKDDSGNVNWRVGHWDNTTTKTTYTLYADPLRNGSGTTTIAQWTSDEMSDNTWYTVNVSNVPEALGPSGHYFYRLEVTRPVEGHGINAFKLRSNGYISTGRANTVNTNFAIVGMVHNLADIRILHPQFVNFNNMGPSTYTGDWEFFFYVPEDTQTLSLWDGDFDRGSSTGSAADTDDFNTDGKPVWASPYAVAERAGAKGSPPDDMWSNLTRREPPVWYEFIDPTGAPIYTNEEPSGTEEWEHYLISSDPAQNPDLLIEGGIKPGFYTLHISGLDLHNTVWLRLDYEIVDQPPPPICDATCPRTIGYWKNNVRKILEGKNRGIQESPESLEAALRIVALESELFRHGIDVTNPQPITDPTPLTLEEANMILQRKKKDYPGDANSMLARALQQNLATWLNWGSGKICDNTVVTLAVPGGTFSGKMEEALAEAQGIILNHDEANMERAKDIGDQINNGFLGEDAEVSSCEDYTAQIPPEEQPPAYEEMPVAPTPEPPPPPVPDPQPDPETCEGVRVNQYNVENPTNNPFYGIKFEYQSGTEIKNGDYDEFQVVLPADVAANMTAVQMEAKAGQNVGMVTLEGYDFTSPIPAGEPITDENGYFAFYFMGAEDNGDGTYTLTYHVQNMTDKGLSHATVGLPEGVVPPSGGSYQSEVCPQ